jgi:hypothetical protein
VPSNVVLSSAREDARITKALLAYTSRSFASARTQGRRFSRTPHLSTSRITPLATIFVPLGVAGLLLSPWIAVRELRLPLGLTQHALSEYVMAKLASELLAQMLQFNPARRELERDRAQAFLSGL